ncbi:MAG: response regulator transcription factor [Dermatophilaceae bacterium]
MSHPLPPPDTSGSQPNDIRVVIVDDHDLIRTALRALLSSESDIEVCGDASGGEAGATLVLELRPDVVLMDLAMPGIGGIEATRRIVLDWPQARVVVLTAFADPRLMREARTAGARGYVLKDADPRTVVSAVRDAAQGGCPISAGATGPADREVEHSHDGPWL